MNLIDNWPILPPMDIVLLRNVLVYFDDDTKQKILKNIRNTLSPGGFLILGEAETTMGVDDKFERLRTTRCSCYKLLET